MKAILLTDDKERTIEHVTSVEADFINNFEDAILFHQKDHVEKVPTIGLIKMQILEEPETEKQTDDSESKSSLKEQFFEDLKNVDEGELGDAIISSMMEESPREIGKGIIQILLEHPEQYSLINDVLIAVNGYCIESLIQTYDLA